MRNYVKSLVKEAKQAAAKLAGLNAQRKNSILLAMADYLLKKKALIIKENKKDMEAAYKNKLNKSSIDRLTLNEKRIKEMSSSLREIASFPEQVNCIIKGWQRPNGLLIQKVKVPLGVIFVIYESRPNVTSDCVGLMIKSSNAGILRGGRDALRSNLVIGKVLRQAAKDNGIDFEPFFIINKPERRIVSLLLKEDKFIDLVIPRGGESLIREVVEKSNIPVIKHYKGICHIFIDKNVDKDKALKICLNAKVQRPSVCNAVETILVHKAIAKSFLPILKKEFDKYGVEIRGDTKSRKILKGIKRATEEDWRTEYLDLIVSLKIVDDIVQAISHINFYGSHHTDSIITNSINNARKFTREVDSACCFINASTRFSDGYQFGLGAEIGISTDKLHARGPMGVEDLTTYKYVVYGNGQIRT